MKINNWRNHLIAERTQLSRLIEQLPQASVIERMSLEARVCEIDAELKGMGDSQPVVIAPCAKGKLEIAGEVWYSIDTAKKPITDYGVIV